jgi:tetratricopeptide (TPR) repeat protein
MGASGAVAAVTGAYMVLFPQTIITVVYWFFFIGTIDIPAMYFILVKLVILDNIIVASTPNVAYGAHLAGYAFGAAAIMLMLATGLIKTTHFDLWSMLKRWNRRRTYRDMVSGGYDPFSATGPTGRIRVKSVERTPAQRESDNRATQIRSDIAQRLGQRNLTAAAELYLELVQLDKSQVLPRQYLLDIANQLAGEGKYEQAAEAYEKFLEHYPDYEYVEQVQLMLGIIYARYLEKSELACRYLETARRRLIDPGQLDMCNHELSKLKAL